MPFKDKEKEREYQARYKREKTYRLNVILSPQMDPDIIAHLQGLQESKVDYLRRLIRNDMDRTQTN